MKNLTCVWRNIYNTARATHSRYYKHFAKHACDFSLILLEPCNFLYKLFQMTFTNDVYNQLRKLISLKSRAIREGEDQSRTTIHCCRKRNSFKPPYEKFCQRKKRTVCAQKGPSLPRKIERLCKMS